jgi:hypothetical protein
VSGRHPLWPGSKLFPRAAATHLVVGPQEEHQLYESLYTNHVTSVLLVSLQATFVSVAGTLVARVERSHYKGVCRRDC